MTLSEKVAIITDGSEQIGLGHVIRELAIARVFERRGADVVFLTTTTVAEQLVRNVGFTVIKMPSLQKIFDSLDNLNFTHVVVDLHEKELKFIDHVQEFRKYIVAVVLSPIGHGFLGWGDMVFSIGTDLDKFTFTRKDETPTGTLSWYSGRAYVPFRNEFLNLPRKQVRRHSNKLLICMGGSDPCHLTKLCLKDIEQLEERLHCRVIIGSAMTDKAELYRHAGESAHQFEIIENIDYLAKVMQDSDLALINGGNVRYELCMTGTPYIAVSMNDTQFSCTEQLCRLGVGVNLGVGTQLASGTIATAVKSLLNDPGERTRMSLSMQGLFDGRGADRVVTTILDTLSKGDLWS